MPLFPQHEKHTRPANVDRVYVLLVVLPPQTLSNKMFWATIPSESTARLKVAERTNGINRFSFLDQLNHF